MLIDNLEKRTLLKKRRATFWFFYFLNCDIKSRRFDRFKLITADFYRFIIFILEKARPFNVNCKRRNKTLKMAVDFNSFFNVFNEY